MCDTPLQEQGIKQDLWIRGELVVVDKVVAGVCPQCDAKVVRADIGRQLAALLGNTDGATTNRSRQVYTWAALRSTRAFPRRYNDAYV